MTAQPLPVGEELRRAREEAGLDLADVASHLRIRSNFLSALEEGRPDALPGITYAIGYIRTYAAFLGLEPDAAVRRFKEEAAGINAKPQLVFPSPAPEGRVPGLVLMLVAAMLAGGAYGGWYWVSERDGNLRDLVPAVPERLAQLIDGDAPSLPTSSTEPQAAAGSYAEANPTGIPVPPAADSAATVPPATAPSATAPSATAPSDTAPSDTVPSGPASSAGLAPATLAPDASVAPAPGSPRISTPEISAPAPAASAPAVSDPAPAVAAVPSAGETATADTEPAAEPSGEPAAAPPAATAPAAEEAPDVTAPPEPTATAAAGDAVSSRPDAAATPEPAPAAEPSVAASPSTDTDIPAAPRIAGLIGASEAAVPSDRTTAGPIDRVMIRATGDSWVQVRDAQGTALFTRVLREGDVYRVPAQAGLRLATGNAGALQVLVDGDPAPSLGGFGEVVRNVALDPALLAAGTAASAGR